MNPSGFVYLDLTNSGFNPQIPTLQQLQQTAQKRPLDDNDQNINDAAKRQKVDNDNYQPNFMQQMQQPLMPQQHIQPQFPPTPQSQPRTAQHQQPSFHFPSFPSPFGNQYQMPQHQNPLQQMQQMQPFPLTSTPARNAPAPSFSFTPMTPAPGSFFATPQSSAPAFPGMVACPQTPLSSRPAPFSADGVVFKEVPSVLSIECGTKVKVTVGELRRRIGAPEFLDVDQLAKLTRHPKTSVRDFQKSFASHGFLLRVNQGKSRASGVLASLIEEEALLLAKDFTKLVSTELSTTALAAVVVSAAGVTRRDLISQTAAIQDHLHCVRAHLLSAGREPTELAKLEKEGVFIDPAMKQFALMTHGFGPLAVVAVVESLIQLVGFIEKSCPSDELIANTLALLPHLTQASTSFNSSFNDSGLGCSFQATPTTTPNSASKKISPSDIDNNLLCFHPNDEVIYNDSVPPRIAYDTEPVSVGELRRRAFGPEKFTVSLMNSYLRKGKKVNTHNDLRDALGRLGITMKPIKGLKPSSWSSLCEMEAMEIGNQTAHLLSFLPSSQPMRDLTATNPTTAAWIKFIAGTVSNAMHRIGVQPAQSRIETNADLQLLRFALITHHFGHSFYASVMKWLQTVI